MEKKGMKRQRLILFSILVLLLGLALTAALAQAAANRDSELVLPAPGPLLGFDYDLPTGRQRILDVNPFTGALNPVAEMNQNWAGLDQFTVDQESRTAYLGGRAPGETHWRLYTIDLSTGEVVSNTLLDVGFAAFGFTFYQAGGPLLAYDYNLVDFDQSVGRILWLDPASGATTTIAAIKLDWIGANMFAADPSAHMAYLGGRQQAENFWRLYRIDLNTGAVSSIALDTGQGGFGFTYYKSGQLLAHSYEGGQQLIVSLDPTTGVKTTLATLPVDFSGAGHFAVDAANDTAYLGGQAVGESDWRVYTVDLTDGSVTSDPVVDRGEGGFGLRFLKAFQRLYLPLIQR
jgi:hypothetical protein